MFVVHSTMMDKDSTKPMIFRRLKIDLEERHKVFVEECNLGMVSISVIFFRYPNICDFQIFWR